MSLMDKLALSLHVDRRKTKIPLLRKVSLTERKSNYGWIFVLPFVLGLILIYIPVLVDSAWFGFAQVQTSIVGNEIIKVVEPPTLRYYKQALSATFLQNLLAGLEQLLLDVPAILIFSLFIAVVLNQKMIGRAAFRAIFFVPVILSTGLMESINMRDIISSGGGMAEDIEQENNLFSMLNVEELFSNMKVGTELVDYVVTLVNKIYEIINYSGVQMLIFLAGLQAISPAIYEACRIDGASSWETFWKITFPMVSPMILVNGIYTIIDSFTRKSNVVMSAIQGIYNSGDNGQSIATAQSWIYFGMVLLVIAAFAGLASLFVFYQKRD